ncbi:MAG: hypothetical protein IKM73_07730 [Acidaminococcaceae bacterium]|nr:hypothetical protein [Acidaminococcaceae bacterium]
MIGEIRRIRTPFFDLATNSVRMKARPGLILAKADSGDFVVLPVSSISRRQNCDAEYDIKVDPVVYPKLNLNCVSFIRTHKQTIVHISDIAPMISDLKGEYPDLFLTVLEKREAFSQEITKQALE